MGALVLDCDAIYHELLESSAELLGEIENRFPDTVQDGKLNRKALGAVVFADAVGHGGEPGHERIEHRVLKAAARGAARAVVRGGVVTGASVARVGSSGSGSYSPSGTSGGAETGMAASSAGGSSSGSTGSSGTTSESFEAKCFSPEMPFLARRLALAFVSFHFSISSSVAWSRWRFG